MIYLAKYRNRKIYLSDVPQPEERTTLLNSCRYVDFGLDKPILDLAMYFIDTYRLEENSNVHVFIRSLDCVEIWYE
jgi:hypothetical protein